MPLERLIAGQRAIAQSCDRGNLSGEWRIDESQFESLAAIAELHDAQLRKASLKELSAAADKLEHAKRERSVLGNRQ